MSGGPRPVSSSADEFRPAIPRSGWSPPEPVSASPARTDYHALLTWPLKTGTFYFAGKRKFLLCLDTPADRARCCYVHPLYTPDGVVITDDFPKDHYHHRGVFWTWPVVLTDGKKYDAWLIHGVHQRFVRWIAREEGDSSARLAVENGWFTESREIIRETAEITAYPSTGGTRQVQFVLTFEALAKPVELRGEPTEDKGYGGFCVRFAPRDNTVITTDKGLETTDTNMVPHTWAQMSGLFGGKPGSLRIDIYPANPDFPNGWCLRRYGFLGVNYPGLKGYTLTRGKPLRMKFKMTVSSGAK